MAGLALQFRKRCHHLGQHSQLGFGERLPNRQQTRLDSCRGKGARRRAGRRRYAR